MEGTTPKTSLLGSATVVAAIISSITAILTAILPGMLSPRPSQPIDPTPPTTAVHSHALHVGEVAFSADRAAPSPSAKPNFTHGVWTITSSIDDEGTDFNGSTLKFTAQQDTPAGIQATGFFEWRTNYQIVGREYVVANYDSATRQLFIESQYVDSPAVLAPGTFSATLSEDERQLLHGAWGNTPGKVAGVLGSWQARR